MTQPQRGRLDTVLMIVGTLGMAFAGLGAASGGKPKLEKYMSVLGISLGPSTMNAAYRHFGGGTVVHNGGDAGASKTHLCCLGPDNSALVFRCWECGTGEELERAPEALRADEYWLVARVALVEFGDPMTGYSVAAQFSPSCTPTTMLSRATAIGGLHLGVSRAAVIHALGKPASEESNQLKYVDGDRRLTVGLEHGKVVSINGARWWE